ncbi:MAG: hypothetical protein IKW65_04950 [Bacteroidales bacterium]|nr:hypothetical protein [Bacteroidales bacterium]
MKRINLYFVISALLLSAIGCTQREDTKIPNPTFQTSFTAVMEGGDQTKALLGETLDDGSRELLWEPGDSIKIFCRSVDYVANYTGHIYVNRETQKSTQAVFEGSMCRSYDVLAVYPHCLYSYQPYWESDGREYYTSHIDFPKVQKYRENNIAKESVPMAAFKTLKPEENYTLQGNLEFRNLYGVLVLNLTGSDKVRSITITAKDSLGQVATLSGFGEIIRTEDSFDKVKMHIVTDDKMAESGHPAITLECPDVQLNTVVPTPFHIALPPAKYSSFSLLITTADGKMMIKESNKELVIKRSTLKHTVPLTYTETIPVNLSERGTSNSYIVEKAGIYTFDASVIGNGAIGIKPYANFHTSDPAISPASVELLWEDTNGLISALNYDSEEKKVSFMHSGIEGNALIAVKDEEGVILWSWHIWCTDKPVEHTYINYQNQTFNVMDRNLGATRADRGTGEEWIESVGLHYQWGRKDPFTYNPNSDERTISRQLTIEESILFPTRVCTNSRWLITENMYLWSDSLKTIYDPCPVGYKVAPKAIWSGFTTTGQNSQNSEEYEVSGTYDKGWNFIYDGTNTAWYPANVRADYWSGVYKQYPGEENGRYWSSSNNGSPYQLSFYHYDEFNTNIYSDQSKWELSDPYNVRCVADEGYVDTSLPTLSTPAVTNIGNTTATFSAEATDQGGSAVIQKGFVWSKSHKPTVDLPTKIIVSSDTGKYSANISNLEQMSGYYVRAFATNSHGTGYSEEFFFSTKYDGIPTNLSNNGTSNCYIVSEEGYYGFDASIIGNGSKGIIPGAGFHTSDPSISPVTAEIVWEDTEDLITYLYFDNTKKTINFCASGKEGNALIAAKDEEGTVLWSWHIWCTDKPADHSYFNFNMKNFIVMDRNIGATRADRGTGGEWRESAGLFYQWGRKDPFSPNRYNYIYYTTISLKESISHPNTMVVVEGGNWCSNSINSNWNEEQKTIYDPCPLGYRISPSDTWSAFSKTGQYTDQLAQFNVSGSWDYGFNFIYDGTNTAWFPQTYIGYYGETETGIGEYWLPSSHDNSGRKFGYNTNGVNLFFDWYEHTSRGHAVRCVKDQVYNDPSMPNVLTTGVSNITESQAKFTGEVTTEGTFGVSERGFVWNINADGKTLNVDTANKEVVGSGMGSFETTVISLKPGTNYFFRSYAISTNGTVYGETLYFKTKETGSNEDLGEDEHEW